MHCVTSRLPIVRSLANSTQPARIYNGLKILEERKVINQPRHGNIHTPKAFTTTQQRSYKTTISFSDDEKLEGMFSNGG